MPIIAQDSDNVARLLFTDSSGKVYTLLTDGTNDAVIDADTSGLSIITEAHKMIHEGNMYVADHIFFNVADNATADLRVTVGASKELHIVVSVVAEGKGEIYIYEGTTYTDGGTAVTAYNKNRTSTNTTDATIKHTPTVDALGTEILETFLPAGTKNKAIGGVRTDAEEWEFKKSTEYLIRFTNRGGADQDIAIVVEYYEVG